MSFEFLKQYFLWELAFFAVGVVLVFIGWAIWKLVKSHKEDKPRKSRFLRRIEKALDIEKVEDGITVYGDVIINPKK